MTKALYLAGSHHGFDWRVEVAKLLLGWTMFDPRDCKDTRPEVYTQWDIEHLEKASAVLIYMDSSNPSGYGLMFEAGFAYAERKTIVFVDAMDEDDPRRKYFDMLRSKANITCKTLEQAAFWLKDER